MLSEIELLERRVSNIENFLKLNLTSMQIQPSITVLMENNSYTDNVESVNIDHILLGYLNHADIFVRVYVHGVKNVDSRRKTVNANGHYEYFFVRPYYTVLMITRDYSFFDDSVNLTMNTTDTSNVHICTNNEKTSIYFAYSQTSTPLPPENLFSGRKKDSLFFIIDDKSQTVFNYVKNNFEVIRKKGLVDIYRNKNTICTLVVKIIGDEPAIIPKEPPLQHEEESFGGDEVPHREKPPEYSFD
jgi:hypothetical protein